MKESGSDIDRDVAEIVARWNGQMSDKEFHFIAQHGPEQLKTLRDTIATLSKYPVPGEFDLDKTRQLEEQLGRLLQIMKKDSRWPGDQ